MANDPHNDCIVSCPPSWRRAALQFVFSDLPADLREQQIRALEVESLHQPDALAGLWIATRGEQLAGAVLARPLPGRAAVVWPPRCQSDDDADLAVVLLNQATEWLCGRGARLAQALPQLHAESDQRHLAAAGFTHLADLHYLLCSSRYFPRQLPAIELNFEQYTPENHDRLRAIVAATYQESRDCPAIDGVRDIDDVLASYRATGVYDPSRWFVVQYDGHDAGCLLLADDPALDHYELVYMGVAPALRGRRFGELIVRQAQWLTANAGRERLVLSVDAANAPALEMYDRAGFTAWDRRPVYVRVLATS